MSVDNTVLLQQRLISLQNKLSHIKGEENIIKEKRKRLITNLQQYVMQNNTILPQLEKAPNIERIKTLSQPKIITKKVVVQKISTQITQEKVPQKPLQTAPVKAKRKNEIKQVKQHIEQNCEKQVDHVNVMDWVKEIEKRRQLLRLTLQTK